MNDWTRCARCGKAITKREVGTISVFGQPGPGVPFLVWCARRGGKLPPILCSTNPNRYHVAVEVSQDA